MFFFSSRRRHTRLQGDWSSDVCSSDLFRKLAGIETYAPTDNVSELTARVNDEGWPSVFAGWLQVSRLQAHDARSEERRVGKEGRSRWPPEQREKEEDKSERDMALQQML